MSLTTDLLNFLNVAECFRNSFVIWVIVCGPGTSISLMDSRDLPDDFRRDLREAVDIGERRVQPRAAE